MRSLTPDDGAEYPRSDAFGMLLPMKTTLVVLTAALAVGSLAATAKAAPGQMLTLDVTGPDANGGKVRRCQDVAYRHGFTL